MTNRKDGGAAFPCGNPTHGGVEGMSLRDYAAIKAMQGLLAAEPCSPTYVSVGGRVAEIIAKDAYAMADAMLAEREKAGSDEKRDKSQN